jgi:hypothetical protein
MSVHINSASFSLLRNHRTEKHDEIVSRWVRSYSSDVKWALEALPLVIEDIKTFPDVWAYHKDEAKFIEFIGITKLDLETPLAVINELKGISLADQALVLFNRMTEAERAAFLQKIAGGAK